MLPRAALTLLLAAALLGADLVADGRALAQSPNADDLLIVDCLLPGQVRRLGQRATFMTARRAVRTTAADCAIRGGEYTSYDRANYATALQIWLPLAKGGDAAAQAFVGEIYEKGLGVEPQYDVAAQWYRQAAEQGQERAQINLGALYERGLGVPQDMQQAVYWYRRASGLDAAELPYIPATVEAELTALKADRERLDRELEEVRRQLDEARAQLKRRSSEAERARAAAAAAQKTLEKQRQQAQAAGDSGKAEALARELAAKRAEADRRAAELADLKGQVDRLNQQAAGLKSALETETAGRAADVQQLKAELARVNDRLLGAEKELEKRTAEVAKSRGRLEEARAALERERGAAGRDDKRVAALEEALKQREAELSDRRKQVSEMSATMASLEEEAGRLKQASAAEREQKAAAAPEIEILDPQIQATRSAGAPAVKVRSVGERVVVGRVSAPAGLVALIVNDRELKADEAGMFRANVALQFPETKVSVVAVDGRGQRAATQFIMQPDGPIAGAKRAAGDEDVPAIMPQSFGKFHALVIGNNDYRQLPKLETAVADAQAVADLLKRRYGFQTTLLLNADRYAILSALNGLRESLTEEDNLLIYYAGHGELDRVNQRGHWLPVDAEPTSTANWISNIQVTDVLNAMAAKQVMVVADSCYSGTLTRAALAQLDSGLSDKARVEWIKLMAGKRARIVLSSGGVQPVLDSGGGRHSVFAKAFLTALGGNGGVLEGQRLYRTVAQNVAATAAAASVEQLPQYAPIKYAGHEAGDFFFVAVN